MAITKVYGKFMEHIVAGGGFDWSTDTIKAALLNDTFVPDQDTQQFFSEVQTHEITGTGYTAGGLALTNKSVSYDAVNNVLQLKCDNIEWTNATLTARYAVIYKDTGNATTSPLIAYIDFEQAVSCTNGSFIISVPTDGFIKLSTP